MATIALLESRQLPATPRETQYALTVAQETFPLFSQRNAEYGDAISENGVLGASIELRQKAARLRQLVLLAPGHGRDAEAQVKDTLRDMANYAIIALMLLEDGNWDGLDSDR